MVDRVVDGLIHFLLNAIESRLTPAKSGVVFVPLEGASDEEMDKRIARWYAGEKVEGQDKAYTGGMVGRIKLVPIKT